MNLQRRELTEAELVKLAASLQYPLLDSTDAGHLLEQDFVNCVYGRNGRSEAERIDRHLRFCDECCAEMEHVRELASSWTSYHGPARLDRLRASILQERSSAQLPQKLPEISGQVPRLSAVVMLSGDVLGNARVHDREPLKSANPPAGPYRAAQWSSLYSLLPASQPRQLLFPAIRNLARAFGNPVSSLRLATLFVVFGVVLGTVSSVIREHAGTKRPTTQIAERAYSHLLRTVSAHQHDFYVYDGSESWRNHGVASLGMGWFSKAEDDGLNHGFPSGFFASSPAVLSKIHVDDACIFDSAAPGGCSTNPASLERERGTVMQISFDPLSPGEFAGVNFEEPANYGVLRSGSGYDLRGVERVDFNAVSQERSAVVEFGVGEKMARPLSIPATWKAFSLDLASLGLTKAELSNVHVLFTIATAYGRTPGRTTILLDRIRFVPRPNRSRVLGLPLANQTFGIIPVADKLRGRVPIPPDQVNANLSTIYESSLAMMTLLDSQKNRDLVNAKLIADTLVYALGHDSQGDPIPRSPDGAGGLHNAYSSGDIALLNEHNGALRGEARLAGFSAGSTLCGLTQFCLVLDGANGGNNAFAALALVKIFEVTGDERYLNAASEIGNWISANLSDSSRAGYGGYFVGYPDEGTIPKVLQRGKSTENNADIYAAFSALAQAESTRRNAGKATTWTERANAAGDFVLNMFDQASGHFHAGTIPLSQRSDPGVTADGKVRGDDMTSTQEFLDADTMATLALAGSSRYRHAIDWHRPLDHALERFSVGIHAAGKQFDGFNLVPRPTAGPNGIAWEFTGQAVSAMRFVDQLYGDDTYKERTAFYLSQIRKAQMSAPFADGEGIVAATLENGDKLPPYEQCLSTPFQCIGERVGLAATTWAILADGGINPLNSSSMPVRGDQRRVSSHAELAPARKTKQVEEHRQSAGPVENVALRLGYLRRSATVHGSLPEQRGPRQRQHVHRLFSAVYPAGFEDFPLERCPLSCFGRERPPGWR